MSLESKVVWSEGMFLNPQHFQQQDRHFEYYVNGRCNTLIPYGWGFKDFELDQQLLNLGKISLQRASGIFPDGTPFNFPDNDDPPPVIEIAENIKNTVVYLAVPVRRPGAVDVLPQDSKQGLARFYSQEQNVRDVTVESGDSQKLQIGKLRLRLLLQTNDLSGFAYIPLLRINEVRQEKDVALDERCIPSVLDCKATLNLSAFIVELHGLLRHRAEAIAGRLADARRGGTAEVADYMLLQVINRVEPMVEHMGRIDGLHPLQLFNYLVQMIGELATFVAPNRRPPEMPVYLHADLEQTFTPLVQTLRKYLSMVYEQTAISMNLAEKKYGVRVAEITDRSLLTSASFVLAVRADVNDEMIRSRFPAQIKIGPVERIRQLVNAAMPGIELKPLPVAPRQIPFRAGYTYFELDQHSQFWKEMSSSGGFAMHVGGDFPGLEMEFWAIRR
ncbi:MAG: type VI secretion system baseplate subunit TssK [Cellvibrionaceae bacterium]|nr:type VI secretion system baseplate subunit TssK [Cellvibrionaceae bacterium]